MSDEFEKERTRFFRWYEAMLAYNELDEDEFLACVLPHIPESQMLNMEVVQKAVHAYLHER